MWDGLPFVAAFHGYMGQWVYLHVELCIFESRGRSQKSGCIYATIPEILLTVILICKKEICYLGWVGFFVHFVHVCKQTYYN